MVFFSLCTPFEKMLSVSFLPFLDYDTTKTQREIDRLVELNNHRPLCNIVEEILRRKSPRFRS